MDCLDGEDEMNCPVTCRSNEYKCPKSPLAPNITICVELFKVCDLYPDCIGGADENPQGCREYALQKITGSMAFIR